MEIFMQRKTETQNAASLARTYLRNFMNLINFLTLQTT